MRPYVLIVEDDVDLRELFELAITDAGYRVMAVENGETALTLLAESALPQFILLDLMMPEMNGLEFIARRGEIEGLVNIPIVLLSAAKPSGLDPTPLGVQVVRKPIELLELLKLVHTHCGSGIAPGADV